MNQRGARRRQVVAVDRTPHGRRVQAPHRLRMADHGGKGVPDDGRRQVIQVEEVSLGVIDPDRAVGRVRHDVGHHHCLAEADAAFGREVGGKRESSRLEVLAVEWAKGGLGRERSQVRPLGGWSFTPVRIRALAPVSGSRRQRSRTRVHVPPAARSGTLASRSRSSKSIATTRRAYGRSPGSGVAEGERRGTGSVRSRLAPYV